MSSHGQVWLVSILRLDPSPLTTYIVLHPSFFFPEFNNWYASWFAVLQICQAVGLGVVLPIFTQYLKLNDLVITTICVISFILGLMTMWLANKAYMLFFAAGVQVFASLATTSIRAALSKVVNKKDIGKVSE